MTLGLTGQIVGLFGTVAGGAVAGIAGLLVGGQQAGSRMTGQEATRVATAAATEAARRAGRHRTGRRRGTGGAGLEGRVYARTYLTTPIPPCTQRAVVVCFDLALGEEPEVEVAHV